MKRLLFAFLLFACGQRAEPTRPVAEEFVEVDFPPPPAEIEETDRELPGRPECVFVPGNYAWQGRRWRWIPGQWAAPKSGCAYAPGVAAWSSGNAPRLYYTPPHWYRTDAPLVRGSGAECSPVSCLDRPTTGASERK